MLSFFYSCRFHRWWVLNTRNVNFPAFCGCESILGRKSKNVIVSFLFPFIAFHFAFISLSASFMLHSFPFMLHSLSLTSFYIAFILHACPFMFLSCSIQFLSCCICFLSCSIHLGFISFHFPSLCIKHTGLRKVICSNRSSGYPPKRLRFPPVSFSFCYRFGDQCRLPSSGFMNMYRYTVYGISSLSFLFLSFSGRWCIGSAKGQGKPSQNERPGVIILSQVAYRVPS